MKHFHAKKQITPLAYPYYFFTVAAVALVGLFDSIYLSISHYRVYADIGYQSFCAISRALNCDTVSQSPYSVVFGAPVSVWGVLGYAFFLSFLTYTWPGNGSEKRGWTLLFLLSMAFTCISVVFALISTFLIHIYCIMCILSYAVNLMLIYFTWIIRKRFRCETFLEAAKLDIRFLLARKRLAISIFSVFFITAVVIGVFYPPYWHMTPPVASKDLATGTTADGHPWIGAKKPKLVIVEFADYRCFQCRKMDFYLRRLIADNPNKLRLVHWNFPMDSSINPIVKQQLHQGSAKLAIISIFAAQEGKFWKMNDILYDIPEQDKTINIRYLAKQAGIPYEKIKYVFQDRRLWEELERDIRVGLKYGLTGTPGFLINGKMYLGRIPSEILHNYAN